MAAGLIKALTVSDTNDVRFVIEVPPSQAKSYEAVQSSAESAVKALDGVGSVSVVMTAHSTPSAPPDLKPQKTAPSGPQKIPGIDRIVAIASGKGGVGKSTVASNIACALAAEGRRVGLLDADVYGPSQPRMLGVSGRPASPDGKTILPMRNFGVTMMSSGLMTNDDPAVVWRGPVLMGALQQMMNQVQWGALDVLIVDLPPGTGDAQITIVQESPICGVVMVTTPQQVAIADVRRSVHMFRQVGVPVLGLVENMSYLLCGHCGEPTPIFGEGGGAQIATELSVPLWGQVPVVPRICAQGEA